MSRKNDSKGDGCDYEVTAILRDEIYEPAIYVDVIAAEIADRRDTSRLIEELNKLHPLHELGHLKRVKFSDGKLYILIAIKDEKTDSMEQLEMAGNLEGLSNFSIFQVPKWRPITRTQYEATKRYWPTQFHEDKRLEKMLKGEFFSDAEVKGIARFMKMAFCEVSQEDQTGTVIVDPCRNEIVARASSSSAHPLHHSVMKCIDAVATAQGGGALRTHGLCNLVSQSESVQDVKGMGDISEDCATPAKKRKLEKQYLCTGYDVYVTMEPCVMCAMALLHSRVRRVFYTQRNTQTGGLESCYKIHVHQKLNHHFEVFRVSAPKKRDFFF